MKIETKFDVGDKVYVVEKEEQQHKYIPCSVCDGRKTIKIENKPEMICLYCDGFGKYLTSHEGLFKIVEEETIVSAVYIYIYPKQEVVFEYRIDSYGYHVKEKVMFKTKELAQEECDRLNKLIENKRE